MKIEPGGQAMSRLCRLRNASHGDDGQWAYSEIVGLREQVEKLTKERDIKEHCITQFELEDLRMKEQLAALAEQNEKAKAVAVSAIKRMRAAHVNCAELTSEVERLLSLPNIASPVLNRIKGNK